MNWIGRNWTKVFWVVLIAGWGAVVYYSMDQIEGAMEKTWTKADHEESMRRLAENIKRDTPTELPVLITLDDIRMETYKGTPGASKWMKEYYDFQQTYVNKIREKIDYINNTWAPPYQKLHEKRSLIQQEAEGLELAILKRYLVDKETDPRVKSLLTSDFKKQEHEYLSHPSKISFIDTGYGDSKYDWEHFYPSEDFVKHRISRQSDDREILFIKSVFMVSISIISITITFLIKRKIKRKRNRMEKEKAERLERLKKAY
jgi:hypothetical protein